MPGFETPGPISATIDVVVGDVRVAASDRHGHRRRGAARATPPARADVTAAEETRVEFAGGHLAGQAHDGAGARSARSATPGPSTCWSSCPRARASAATRRWGRSAAPGPLGDCRLKTAPATSRSTMRRPSSLKIGAGDVTWSARAATPSSPPAPARSAPARSAARPRSRTPTATPGSDEVAGDLRIRSANGDIAVGLAHATVGAEDGQRRRPRRRGRARRRWSRRPAPARSTSASPTATPRGWTSTPASGTWTTRSRPAARPAPGEETVEVRARSGLGDITIRRAEVAA